MTHSPQSPRLVLAALIAGALALSGGAVALTATGGDAAFGYIANIQFIIIVLAWAMLALAARWLVVGKVGEIASDSSAMLIWGGFRVCLLLAVVALLLGWVIALALGHDVRRLLLQAVVLMVVVAAVTGIIGGAAINSWLAVRHWVRGKSV